MTTQQLEHFLHFFGKEKSVILIRKKLEDGIYRIDYDYLFNKYSDVCIRINVSKHNNIFRPSEFPRTNQRENAFVVKKQDWKEVNTYYDFLFASSVEDRIKNKENKKIFNNNSNVECSSLNDIKNSIENYMLSHPIVDITESVLPLLKVIDKISLQKKLKLLNYNDFLKTAYWAHSRFEKIKDIGYKCQLCGKKTKTPNVHHNTYEHHGREMEYLNDLIVLCPECHKKYHNKEPSLSWVAVRL